jgi:eukaryotic-like serine/threonine-protein kinase
MSRRPRPVAPSSPAPMDRPAANATAATPPPDPVDRTQTLNRGRATDDPVATDAGTAATLAARGTLSDGPHTAVANLPVDDPDRYALVGEHARGGLGRIVRATDTRLGRTVAVKELLRKSDAGEALFVREALITARLQHPGIVPVMEAGRWPSGEPYYVMRLVEGRSLKELIADRTTIEQRLTLLPSVIAVADAVGYAHSQDVIHRDVKPANVVVGEFGETVVVDWGLARDGRRDASTLDLSDEELARVPRSGSGSGASRAGSAETVSGRVIGTPQYMAPEQARGEPVDARADVYSIGALLYEVLAGVAPYAGGGADAILASVHAGPPAPVVELAPNAPGDLLAIVGKAMSRDPADRYPTARELAADLRRFQTGQLVTAQQYGPRQLIRRWIVRHRGPVAVAAIGALAILVVTIGMVRRVVYERNAARVERGNAVAAEHEAKTRANALSAHQAESSVRRDPTAAVAWLKQLPIDADNAAAAMSILEEALQAGVARHVLREEDWVWGVAVSPDGALLATASKDAQVRLYDLRESPPSIRILGVHDGGISATAFADGGTRLITGGYDGRVLSWAVAGGAATELGALSGHIARLDARDDGYILAFSEAEEVQIWRPHDGRPLVGADRRRAPPGFVDGDVSPVDPRRWLVGYDDGRLVELSAGDPLREVGRVPSIPRRIAYDPTGARVAVYDGASLHVVDVAAAVIHTVGTLTGPIELLVWSPDGATIAAAGKLPEIRLYAADATDAAPRTLHGHTDSMYSLRFSRDGQRLLTASDDGTARLWDLVTGSVEVLLGHDDDVVSAIFTPDESTAITASLDGSVRIWSIGASGVRVLGGDAGEIVVTRMVGDDAAVTVSRPLQVSRWDLRTGDRTVVLPAADREHKWAFQTISARGDVAIAVGGGDDLTLLRADGSRRSLGSHRGGVVGGGFSRDGNVLFTAGRDGVVYRWDLVTHERVAISRGRAIAMMAVSPRGDRLLVVRDGRCALHDRDGRVIAELGDRAAVATGGSTKVVFAPDGVGVVIAGKQGRAVYWRPDRGDEIPLESIQHGATNLAMSPDGRHLAGAMGDRTVRIWDLESGAVVKTLHGHVDLANNVAYSPDGRRLASISYDRTIRIWDIASGESRVLRGHRGSVEAVAWIDDGRRLVTASRDGTVRLWPTPSTVTPSPDQVRLAIARATTAVVGAGERVATPHAR